jgi:hypothetical protein
MAQGKQESKEMAQARDAQELKATLIRTLQAMKERVPDWYGQAMMVLAEVSQNEILSEMAAIAYQEELAEVLEERPALPGVH